MYLAYNRSLHPSLPLLVMIVRLVLCACSPLKFIQSAQNPLYASLVLNQMLTRWILLVLCQHAASPPPSSLMALREPESEPGVGGGAETQSTLIPKYPHECIDEAYRGIKVACTLKRLWEHVGASAPEDHAT